MRSCVFGRNKRVQVSNFGDENVRRVSADGLPLCCGDVPWFAIAQASQLLNRLAQLAGQHHAPDGLWISLRGTEVRSRPDQEAFVRQAIESGRFHRAEDAVEEASTLWEERERNERRR